MSAEGKNVLITGGAGFIGSHLVEEYLANKAEKVVVYDDFSTGTIQNLKHVKDERLKVIKGSVLDREKLGEVVKKKEIHVIDHLAAELEVYTGIKDSLKDARTNVFGTLNVLNVALQNSVEKVLFASSGAVYGEAQYLPIDEEHPLEPHWPYGVSKLAAERYCTQYSKLFGLNVTAFRYSIVYGPREWLGRVLTMFIKRIFLENKAPVVFGDGAQVRDYVYVSDVTRAHMMAVGNEKSAGQVFNLSSGEGISVKKLAEKLIELSGKRFEVIFDDPREGEASRFQPERIRLQGELRKFVLSNSKAKKRLGWSPRMEFRDGVLREIEWILSCPHRWKVKPRV